MAHGLARRLIAFGSLPLLGAVVPMLVLPIVARVGGPSGWVAILGGQAIGNVASVVVMWGWGIEGQAKVARATDDAHRIRLYRSSLRTRGRLVIVVLAVGVPLTWLTVGRVQTLAAVLMFTATAMAGLSLVWFATGIGRASYIALYELIPRIAAVVLTVPALVLGAPIWIYPLLLLAFGTGGLVLFHRTQFQTWWPSKPVGSDRHALGGRGAWRAASVAISGSVYSSAPVPVASGVGGGHAESIASADRFYRFGTLALVALSNGMQGWALDGRQTCPTHRVGVGVLLHALAGVVGGTVIALMGPAATVLLFGEDVRASAAMAALYGCAFLAVALSTGLLRLVLVPFGGIQTVLVGTLTSLCLGGASMIWFGNAHGPVGVAAGLAISEWVMVAFTVVGAIRLRRMISP